VWVCVGVCGHLPMFQWSYERFMCSLVHPYWPRKFGGNTSSDYPASYSLIPDRWRPRLAGAARFLLGRWPNLTRPTGQFNFLSRGSREIFCGRVIPRLTGADSANHTFRGGTFPNVFLRLRRGSVTASASHTSPSEPFLECFGEK
jgi:hypothetical protein